MSWLTSPKRTRSYPYALVYGSLGFSGKRVTIIPLVKGGEKKEIGIFYDGIQFL